MPGGRIDVQIGPVGITHGSQLTLADVGYTAYLDPSLGRKLILSDLTDHYGEGTRQASDYYGSAGTQPSPKVIYKQKLDAVRMDLDWITLRGSMVDDFMTNNWGANQKSTGMALEWVTADTGGTVGDFAVSETNWSAYRCSVGGQSDGGRVDGGVAPHYLTENIWKDAKEAPNDHNDCLQNVGGDGSLYSLRSQYWQQAAGDDPSLGSSCVQYGDFASGSHWYAEHVSDAFYANPDNSNPMLRLYDGGLTSNITYRIASCYFYGIGSLEDAFGPPNRVLDRGGSNTTPWSQITWTDNWWVDTNTGLFTPIASGF